MKHSITTAGINSISVLQCLLDVFVTVVLFDVLFQRIFAGEGPAAVGHGAPEDNSVVGTDFFQVPPESMPADEILSASGTCLSRVLFPVCRGTLRRDIHVIVIERRLGCTRVKLASEMQYCSRLRYGVVGLNSGAKAVVTIFLNSDLHQSQKLARGSFFGSEKLLPYQISCARPKGSECVSSLSKSG